MNRRTALATIMLPSLSANLAVSGRPMLRWIAKARRRREIAAHFERSARVRRQFITRSSELLRLLEGADVAPSLRDELDRDVARLRLSIRLDSRRADNYIRLAALYHRAALRPWLRLPPPPKLDV